MLSVTSSLRHFTRGYKAFKSDEEFKGKASEIFYELADSFGIKYEPLGDDFLVDAQDDSLKLSTDKSEVLLSRQTPGRQIWVSTPVSGSLKFDYDTDEAKWFDTKEVHVDLKKKIEEEVGSIIKKEFPNKM